MVRNYSSAPAGHLDIAPNVDGEAKDFYFCGDWVRYSGSPISYMEKAMVTGIEAARDIAYREGGNPGPEPNSLPEAQPFQLEAQEIVRQLTPSPAEDRTRRHQD